LPAQAIKQPSLVDQEANASDRPCLRLDDNIGKPCQPGIDVVALAAELERGVIGFAVTMDRFCERPSASGPQGFAPTLFRQSRARYGHYHPRRGWMLSNHRCEIAARVIAGSGFADPGALSLNHAMKRDISAGTVSDGGASIMHTRRMKRARHNLHRIFMATVAPDIGNVAAPIHHHRVPREQGLVVKRRSMIAIHIGHQVQRPRPLPRWRGAESVAKPDVARVTTGRWRDRGFLPQWRSYRPLLAK
jgi:hypothetical protein